MSVVAETPGTETVVALGGETAQIEKVARDVLAAGGTLVDTPEFVAAARAGWDDLPVPLRRAVREFRRRSGPDGLLVLRGLPIAPAELSDTPAVAGSVQRTSTVGAAVLLMIAAGLGDPAAFRPEKSGALVQDVVPVPGLERVQGNVGSSRLTFHTENAFHPHRPDYVMLLCLRTDHDGVGGTRTACVRRLLPELSPDARAALRLPEFVTAAPPSFGAGGGSTPPRAVLTGAVDDPDLCVDFSATAALTAAGETALAELAELCERQALACRLTPGDLVVVDNHVTVHGRSAFTPRYDGQDRWLQRTFVLADLRRSRATRPADGHVLTD